MILYAISGLGANELVFDKLKWPSDIEFCFLPWISPFENESIESYASRMAETIDENEEFILTGLSFGGIIAQEIAKIKQPKKLILFNTIKSEKEIPFWISINNSISLYKLFPYFILNNSFFLRFISKLLVLTNKDRPNLSQIYTVRDKHYTAWAFEKIIKWKNNVEFQFPVFHIHGDSDFVFPIAKIKDPIRIKGGSHICVYEKYEIISVLLKSIL